MVELVDTHCHIHAAGRIQTDKDYTAEKWTEAGETDADSLLKDAIQAGVTRVICVGTDLKDSRSALDFVDSKENAWASAGIHPHEAAKFGQDRENLEKFEDVTASKSEKLVAIGECGLDYHYEHSPKDQQIKLLEYQLDIAGRYNLPVIFHIREAYTDFWPILDNFDNILGVLHSFSATTAEVDKAMSRGLHVGLNGIMTFAKDDRQLEAAKTVPLDRLLLETDAPYLTPRPIRGKICKPEHVKLTAEYLSELRGEPIERLASQTTSNAQTLFKLS